jgi:hypothetical protein
MESVSRWICEVGGGRTQTTRSFGSMRLLSSMAFRTAEPSLPVALVRASFPMVDDEFVYREVSSVLEILLSYGLI